MSQVKKGKVLIGIVVIFFFEFFLRNVVLPLPQDITSDILTILLLVEWTYFFLMVFWWVPKMEGGKIGFGFTPLRFRYFWIALLTFIGVMVVSITYAEFASRAFGLQSLTDLQPMLEGLGVAPLLLLFFAGMILEEVLYRGYLIERLRLFIKSPFVVGFISWFLFVAVHFVFFGLGPMLESAILAVALVILYMKTKSIWPSIFLHGLNNFVGYILFPIIIPMFN